MTMQCYTAVLLCIAPTVKLWKVIS